MELAPPRAPDFTAPHHPTRILVRFAPGAADAGKAQAHAAAGGSRTVREFRLVNGLESVEVPAGRVRDAVMAYSRNPNVLYAEPDYLGFPEYYCADLDPCPDCPPPTDPEDPLFVDQWALSNIKAEETWCFHGGWTGDTSFRIAVIDTGVAAHEDLTDNWWRNAVECAGGSCAPDGDDDDGNGYDDDFSGWDFRDVDNDPADTTTDGFHGTHVAGIIAAIGNNEAGIAGINWSADIVRLRIDFSASQIVAALEYCADNDIRVSNNSYTSAGYSQAVYDAIKAAGQAIGHIFVTVAGSNSTGSNIDDYPVYPASYTLPNIIAVAATDYENPDARATFEGPPTSKSNYGPISVDLGAPGDDIVSTVKSGAELVSDYEEKDGTSMAAPMVTGVVGLVWGRHPTWTWRQVRDRVLFTVRPVATDIGTGTASGGVVNALAAVWDCNENDEPDEDDISTETSEDCTSNGVPDECEPDCNSNSVADSCDILDETSEDCQDEWHPGSGRPDECDIALGISEDCNSNDIPDECEADCDGDGVPDDCDADCSPGDLCCNSVCQECCNDSDCAGGDLCCSGVCRNWECCDDSDCGGSTPVCRTSDHTCVECVDDSDCPPFRPHCVVDPGQCVSCQFGCPQGPSPGP